MNRPLTSLFRGILGFLVIVSTVFVGTGFAQVEVPITYDVGDNVAHIGFLVGGFLAGEEGLSVLPAGATQTQMLPYDKLDRIEKMKLAGTVLKMHVIMNDGRTFAAEAKLAADLPVLVLADQVGEDDEAQRGPEHSYSATNLKGLVSVDFEAEQAPEIDVDAIKALDIKFIEALNKGDMNLAVDLHNKIGDALGETDSDDAAGDGTGSGAIDDASSTGTEPPAKPKKSPAKKDPKSTAKKSTKKEPKKAKSQSPSSQDD